MKLAALRTMSALASILPSGDVGIRRRQVPTVSAAWWALI